MKREEYLKSLCTLDLSEFLIKLRADALEEKVPIITDEAINFIQTTLRMIKPKNILEIGTAVGFSSLVMLETIPDVRITTIEKSVVVAEKARANFEAYYQMLKAANPSTKSFDIANIQGLEWIKGFGINTTASHTSYFMNNNQYAHERENLNFHRPRIITDDAKQALERLVRDNVGKEVYDFVFIDAAKSHYLDYFNLSAKLLKRGGVIVCDNTLFKGMVYDDELMTKKSNTIVKNLNEFLENLSNRKDFNTVFLGTADGITLSIKNE